MSVPFEKLNPGLLERSDSFEFSLDQQQMVAQKKWDLKYSNGSYAWVGETSDYQIQILNTQRIVSFKIMKAGLLFKEYYIDPKIRQVKLNPPSPPVNTIGPECEELEIIEERMPSTYRAPAFNCNDTPSGDMVVIDILVVYTQAAEDFFSGNASCKIECQIDEAIAEVNTVLANSQAPNVTINLKKAEKVDYVEVNEFKTNLDRLDTPGDGYLDEVIEMRCYYGADLVSLVVSPDERLSCGRANIPTDPNTFAPDRTYNAAFSVVDALCMDINKSFSHEIGHNLGLRHALNNYKNRDESCKTREEVNVLCNDFFGFYDNVNKVRTVMVTTSFCASADPCSNCQRLFYFSNPNINLGVEGASNNARAVQLTAPIVSQYSENIPSATLYLDADGDGFGDPDMTTQECPAPAGYVINNLDCDDSDPNIYPDAEEIDDGQDNNCNGLIDEVFASCPDFPDYPALAALYYANPGSTLDWDLSNCGYCGWTGVTCDGNRKVIGLNIIGRDLSSIPPEIGDLDFLENLYFSQNNIAQLPNEIGQLSRLKTLFGANNSLTSIPNELGNLTQLEIFHVPFNNLTNLPNDLGDLTQLKVFHVANNQLQGIPSSISFLSDLELLILHQNEITFLPKGLGNLGKLKELRLENNQLSCLPPDLQNLCDNGTLHFITLYQNLIPLNWDAFCLNGAGACGADADGDGVPDEFDLCINQPFIQEGLSEEEDCDGDQVANNFDQCPGLDDRIDLDLDGCPDCRSNTLGEASGLNTSTIPPEYFCDKKEKKVYLTHHPPDNPDNPQVVCVSLSAAEDFLTNYPLDFIGFGYNCSEGDTEYTNNFNTSPELLLYPNPARDRLNFQVQLAAFTPDVVVRVFDIRGRLMSNRIFVPENNLLRNSLNVGNFPGGVYFLEIIDGEFQHRKRFVISK